MDWSLYKKVDNIPPIDILEGFPGAEHAYVWRSLDPMDDVYGFANHLVDAKIRAKEYIGEMIGRGVLTGYFHGRLPPAEEVYRNVRLGRFVYRSDAIDLLEYGAFVAPDKNPNRVHYWRLVPSPIPLVEASSLEGLKPLVDEVIATSRGAYRDPDR